MPIFSYKGLDRSGKEIKNSINAESIIQAKSKVKNQGIMLIDIKEKKAKSGTESSSLSMGSKVKISDLALMTRQLATLVKAKIQIVEALSALQDQIDNDYLKVVISEVKQDVNEGSSLAKAMSKHSKVFDNVYVNMVEAGEASGTLEVVLLRLADFTEAQLKLKNKIQSAMLYPIIMAVVGTLLISVIFLFVIPKLAKIFTNMKMELPLPTKIAMGISDFMVSYWWSLPLFALFFLWMFRKWVSTEKGKRKWDAILLKLIIIGNLTRKINVSRFCSTLATLLNSGVPILTSLKIVKNLIPNMLIKDAIEEAKDAVSEGASMTGPLKESGHFPNMVTHMVSLGEKSGELEDMLKIVAENYQEQVDSEIDGLTSLLEPLMIVFLGATVFFVVISVIMPMMQLNQLR
ncbi:MAG: type II secretion system protein GspF [Halobacteriovoraceae bacterium]|nr:type II secretion system protein GspF [Halobacteriovoraceae bacterium]|tara:strand:+ start:99728 stop:100939 length:1212 start_codon:yes stop_codon:yes gene_type:complete